MATEGAGPIVGDVTCQSTDRLSTALVLPKRNGIGFGITLTI